MFCKLLGNFVKVLNFVNLNFDKVGFYSKTPFYTFSMSNLRFYNAKLMAYYVKYSIKHDISGSNNAIFDGLNAIFAFFNAIFGVESLSKFPQSSSSRSLN